MKKTDKKTENNIRVALTEVCSIALEKYDGFAWITHTVNYKHFPCSLSIICVFENNEQLAIFCDDSDKEMFELIQNKLDSRGIKIDNIPQCVSFDTEENCSIKNDGKWRERFKA